MVTTHDLKATREKKWRKYVKSAKKFYQSQRTATEIGKKAFAEASTKGDNKKQKQTPDIVGHLKPK